MNRIKQWPWVQPLMPQLRRWRRSWDQLRHAPAYFQEERASKKWSQRQFKQADAVERALNQVQQQGGYFSGWALSRSALRTFCSVLFDQIEHPSIVEWGSGQSTLFWSALHEDMAFDFVGVEHDPDWFEQLQPQLTKHTGFHYHLCPLKQLSDQERQLLWQQPTDAEQLYSELGALVPESERGNTRLKNAFYDFQPANSFAPASIDGLVLDGPNGSGRDLAFALLYTYLKSEAWILIDDFDHYPFLDGLGNLFHYEVVHIQINAGKRWCLVQLKGRKP